MKELNEIFKKPFNPKGLKSEKKIHSLLKKGLNTVEIFKKIKSDSNVEELSRFLYNSGMDQALLKFSISRLKNNKSVAWAFVLKVLIKYNISPEHKLKKILFTHWLRKKENQSLSLFACEQWGDLSPEFQQMSQVYLQDMEERNLSKEKELLEQLAFVQAQDLVQEEEEIISKLLIINPENDEYKKLKENLKEKKAILTIQEQKKSVREKSDLEGYNFKAAREDLKEDWLSEIFKIARKDKSQVKNLALFLYFNDCPVQAIKLLETHIISMSDYWFYLDWCLETKQYTKGLELINQISANTSAKTVSLLPLIYTKAQILYALGQKSSAIESLQIISQFKPDYKSAEYLLNKWLKN